MRYAVLLSSVLLLAACQGEVTDGGTGSDTDPEELREMRGGDGMTEREEEADAEDDYGSTDTPLRQGDPRAGDYPAPGEQVTRNPLEPGSEEPGGKDQPTEKEIEAMNEGDDPDVVSSPPDGSGGDL